MTSSSEQDNLDFLLDEETDNNCSNTLLFQLILRWQLLFSNNIAISKNQYANPPQLIHCDKNNIKTVHII